MMSLVRHYCFSVRVMTAGKNDDIEDSFYRTTVCSFVLILHSRFVTEFECRNREGN